MNSMCCIALWDLIHSFSSPKLSYTGQYGMFVKQYFSSTNIMYVKTYHMCTLKYMGIQFRCTTLKYVCRVTLLHMRELPFRCVHSSYMSQTGQHEPCKIQDSIAHLLVSLGNRCVSAVHTEYGLIQNRLLAPHTCLYSQQVSIHAHCFYYQPQMSTPPILSNYYILGTAHTCTL